jgi:hypothetical protein
MEQSIPFRNRVKPYKGLIDDSDSSDANVAQLINQPHETLLLGTRPFVVSLARTVQ